MRCPKCGHNNDADAEFCVNCGVKLRISSTGMNTTTKMLIVVVIVLVVGIGLVSGILLSNQAKPITNTSVNDTSVNFSQSPAKTNQNSTGYKSFSNGIVYFEYPSSWNFLQNSSNIMVIVGLSNYPAFSVYDESKYGHTSLYDYVSQSKSGMTNEGYIILSERSLTVDGLSAYEIIYQGETIIQQMVLVEKSPGSQYFALVGVDYINHFDQARPLFDQVINSFQFLS